MDNKDYLLNLIDTLEDKNQSQLKKLYQDIIEEMPNAKWSSNNKHQWREWGYYDHIADVLKFWKILYEDLNRYRTLPFSFDDVIVVILIHDIEKPYKYIGDKEKYKDLLMLNDHSIRDTILEKYNIQLSTTQQNGADYIHGEWHEYSKTERIMWPLAAFCHSIDTISARIYFNDGK